MQSNTSTNEPRMSTATAIAQKLYRKERERGSDADAARLWLAEKLKTGTGTVRNLIRGRVKRVDETIRDRLRALLMREIEAEIARLQHELEIHRQGGHHLASDEISEIESHLAAAKAIMTGA